MGLHFLSDNQVDIASISISTGTEHAQFPLTNIQNTSPSKKFRGIGGTVVIVLDLLTNRDIDTIAVLGDPLNGFGFTTMSIKTSTTTDFSLSVAIPITISNEHNVGFEFITPVSHRYVQVTVTGAGPYQEINQLFIGERLEVDTNDISISSFRYYYDDKSNFRSNKYGQKFIEERNKIKSIAGSIEFCTKAEFETLDDLFLYHREVRPLWFIVDPDSEAMNDGAYRLMVYGYFEKIPQWSASGGQHYNTSFRVEEAV